MVTSPSFFEVNQAGQFRVIVGVALSNGYSIRGRTCVQSKIRGLLIQISGKKKIFLLPWIDLKLSSLISIKHSDSIP